MISIYLVKLKLLRIREKKKKEKKKGRKICIIVFDSTDTR